jgi:hypothetical protein
MHLNSGQRRTLEPIFQNPVRADIAWAAIESLLQALGAELSEGSGSRVWIYLKGVKAVFHRPHPERETDRGTVKSMQRFLISAGVVQSDND